jgi:hypothetical protein
MYRNTLWRCGMETWGYHAPVHHFEDASKRLWAHFHYHGDAMRYPIKVCVVCSEEFELKPGKPGFANHCPQCSAEEANGPATKRSLDADERRAENEANEARRRAIRDLLYRKDS